MDQHNTPIYKDVVTQEEQIVKMKEAMTQAIKVMGDRFGSRELDGERAMEDLNASMQMEPVAVAQLPQSTVAVKVGA